MSTTGLVLGGGGSRGAYEIGVWQALRELGINIDIVTGTSVGAINGALVCQGSFDLAVSIWKELETHMVFDIKEDLKTSIKFDFNFDIGGMPIDKINSYAREIFTNGGADVSGLKKLLNEYLDENIIRASSVEFGLVAVEYPSMKPFYMKKNDIPIGSLSDYILASAACFPAIKTYEIGNKKFIDGGYSDNLPIGFAIDLGSDDIIAVDLESIGIVKNSSLISDKNLLTISSSWDLGNFLIFDKLNSARIMRLGYLDTMKKLDLFHGSFYTFAKGHFIGNELAQADAAAQIFELNPEIIYTKKYFDQLLREKINSYITATSLEINLTSEVKHGFFSKIKSDFSKVQNDLSSKAITVNLANDLKHEEKSKSLLLARNSKLLLKDQMSAADYINKRGLI